MQLSHKHRVLLGLLTVGSAAASAVATAGPPSTSAYFTDSQNTQVQDATSQSIGQVNMISCVMSSMRPDALVNQGPYVALIDKNKCDAQKESSTSNSGGSSGASQAPDYMTATVNSTRASNSDPMIVSAWISINQDNTPVTVYAHISATTAPTASDPYGTFRLDYCGKTASGGDCMMNGFIQAGNGTLSYYESDSGGGGGGGGGSQTTALQLTSVGTTTGTGSLNAPDNQGGQVAFDFAYDRNYFLRNTNGTPQCFNRDATAPGTGLSVWQYGLYDSSTGDRINRNSGFPIQYTGSDGKTYQGYIGYYGLNSQSGAPAPTDGATVQKVDYSNGAATTATYKVLVNGGRLTRFKKQTTTLAAIDQIQFNAFVNSVTGSGLPDLNTQYVMHWDETLQQFIVTGEMQCRPERLPDGSAEQQPAVRIRGSEFLVRYGPPRLVAVAGWRRPVYSAQCCRNTHRHHCCGLPLTGPRLPGRHGSNSTLLCQQLSERCVHSGVFSAIGQQRYVSVPDLYVQQLPAGHDGLQLRTRQLRNANRQQPGTGSGHQRKRLPELSAISAGSHERSSGWKSLGPAVRNGGYQRTAAVLRLGRREQCRCLLPVADRPQ